MRKWTVGVIVEYRDGRGKHFFLVDSVDPEAAIKEAKAIAEMGQGRHTREFYWPSARVEVTRADYLPPWVDE